MQYILAWGDGQKEGRMRLRWGKAAQVKDLVVQHAQAMEDTVQSMATAIRAYLNGTSWEEMEELSVATHRQEGKADDIQRKTELELARGALLASSRQTLLRLVAHADRLANSAEESLSFLVLQRIEIPELLHPIIREIVEITVQQTAEVKAAIGGLVEGHEETTTQVESVDHKEGQVDELERRAISRLFSTDLPLSQKILVRQFVEHLVEISDRGEDVADVILIALAARTA
ncbi:MAG: DUF47 family protein [Candidatus Bipolaricaulota bacterium]